MSMVDALTPTGWELLQQLTALLTADTAEPDYRRLGQQLRGHGIPADTVSAVLTQLELRQLGRTKFAKFASELVYTRTGYEQATRMMVAAQHATRYQGQARVADLGCGIGADALALAGLSIPVTGYEIDEETAAAATVNLRFFPEASVRQADVTTLDSAELAGFTAFFCDPARRDSLGRRLTNPESWSPKLSWCLQLPSANIGVKVAPGIKYRDLPETTGERPVEVQWVSVAGQLVEAGIWIGQLAGKPGRSALILDADGAGSTIHVADSVRSLAAGVPIAKQLGKYLFSIDPALLRAGGLAAAAKQVGAGSVSKSISYLTGDQVPEHARAWEIVANVAPRSREIKAAVSGFRDVQIHQKGSGMRVSEVRKKIGATTGEGRIHVFLTRIKDKHRAIIATDIR